MTNILTNFVMAAISGFLVTNAPVLCWRYQGPTCPICRQKWLKAL